MKRLVVAFIAVVVVAAMGVVAPTIVQAPGPGPQGTPAATAHAQTPGQPYCGPWQIAWYVSYGRYWYLWVWRWCYNPSLQYPWYIDWYGWYWGPYAGYGYSPGYQYSTSIQQ